MTQTMFSVFSPPATLFRVLRHCGAAALAALLATAAFAQEPLYTNRATDLRTAPEDGSPVLRSLPEKSAVIQLERRGAWTRVQLVGADADKAADKPADKPAYKPADKAGPKSTGKNATKGADKGTDKSTDKTPPKETGWVRMMHLRGGVVVVEAQASSGSGFMSGFGKIFGGGSSRGSTQAQSATVGIRGLSPEELKTASPDAAALAKMNSYKSDKPEAERYAKEAKLAQANVPELNDAAGGRR